MPTAHPENSSQKTSASQYKALTTTLERLTTSTGAPPSALEVLGLLRNFNADVHTDLRLSIAQAAFKKYPDETSLGAEVLKLSKTLNLTAESIELARTLAEHPLGSDVDCAHIADALSGAGRHAEAAAFLKKAVKKHPRTAALHHNLGTSLKACDRLPEALEAFRRAIELQPYSDVSLTMAGSVLKEMGRLSEALEFHGAAVRINPNSPTALYNMGNSLQAQGELSAAAQAYQKALALRPDWPELLNNLCAVLARLDRCNEALPLLINLAKLRNHSSEELARIVMMLRELNHPDEAIRLAEVLIKREPDNDKFRMLKTACLPRVGRSAEAVVEYKKAIAKNPEDLGAYRSLIYTANYLPYEDPQELFEFYRRYSELIETPLLDHRYPARQAAPFPRKLRIGYVSGDFCHHPVGIFIEPILRSHDRNAFEIFCYYNYAREDRVTKVLRSLPVHWRVIEPLSDRAVCDLIREDEIDILVDLSGHTTRNRLNALILKPAPIQVTMIGCMQTTGLRAIDYRITDSILDPCGATEALHTEKLIRMETGPLCFQPHPATPETAPLPCLSGAPFTFGSFNNLAKVTPKVLDLWSKVLTAVPEARMQIVSDSEDLFLREMQKRGISKTRFTCLRRMPEPDYLAAHSSVDLILDTFPFCGLTTSMSALWMGVPSITLPGNTSASRAGASLLGRLNLNQFVAHSPHEYVQIAKHYARNPEPLAQIRSELRNQMRVVWADAEAHTLELEQAFRKMWVDYSGEEPLAPPKNQPQPKENSTASAPTPIEQTPQKEPGQSLTIKERLDKKEAQPPDRSADPFDFFVNRVSECAESVDPTTRLEELKQFLQNQKDSLALLRKAEAHFQAADQWKPLATLAEIWGALDKANECERCFGLAKTKPSSALEWSWLSRCLLRAGLDAMGKEALVAACSFEDATAEATLGLSCILAGEGDTDGAEQLCRRTIGKSPSVWEAYLNLGNLLHRKGEFHEALKVAEPATRLSTDPKLLLNLAAYQEKCGEYIKALQTLEKIIEQDPTSSSAYLNLGNCFLFLGMPNEAVKAYRKTLALSPASDPTFSNYLHAQNFVPDADPQEVFALHRQFAREFEAPLIGSRIPHTNPRDPSKKLRIAYISPDFRNHSVAYFIEPLLRHHDRSQFEVIGILSHTWRDQKTEKLKSLCDQWIDAGGLSDEDLANVIRREKVDIAVDLICHSQGSRVLAFARKPAPVQISMIGMQQTTGIDSMDFRVTDAFMDPPGLTERFHSESLLRLPVAVCFQPPEGAPSVGPLPALENGHLTFASFNNFAKAHIGVLRMWAQVLHRIPNSKLLAIVPEGCAFHEQMIAQGIQPERLISSARKSGEAYWRLHHEIDFALDCFPFAGLTVSSIAAWMGVPTLTIAGNTPSSRAGASLMHSLELNDFIASDPQDFVERAVRLASDLPKLAAVRASMRARMEKGLTNAPLYMATFEKSLREIWERWCRGESFKS